MKSTQPGMAHRANSFDAIRLIAAGVVVYHHAFLLVGLPEPIAFRWDDRVLDFGAVAVIVFFVVSGYLITQSWNNSPSLTSFSMKRAARIWPGLIAVVTISVFVLGPLVTSLDTVTYFRHAETWGYLRTLFLAPVETRLPGVFEQTPLGTVNASLWTLPIEVVAYAALATIGTLFLRRGHRWVIPVAALALAGFGTASTEHSGNIAALLAFFFMGAACQVYRIGRNRWLLAFAVAAFWVSLTSSLFFLAFPAMTYIVLFIATGNYPGLRRVSRWGDPSYGTYIYGAPVGQLLYLAGVTSLLPMFVISLVLSVAAGYISWHLVENPALSWLKKPRSAPILFAPAPVGAATAQ